MSIERKIRIFEKNDSSHVPHVKEGGNGTGKLPSIENFTPQVKTDPRLQEAMSDPTKRTTQLEEEIKRLRSLWQATGVPPVDVEKNIARIRQENIACNATEDTSALKKVTLAVESVSKVDNRPFDTVRRCRQTQPSSARQFNTNGRIK